MVVDVGVLLFRFARKEILKNGKIIQRRLQGTGDGRTIGWSVIVYVLLIISYGHRSDLRYFDKKKTAR